MLKIAWNHSIDFNFQDERIKRCFMIHKVSVSPFFPIRLHFKYIDKMLKDLNPVLLLPLSYNPPFKSFYFCFKN